MMKKELFIIMFFNTVIEIAWIFATVYFVVTGHTGWAIVAFIGALCGGYGFNLRKHG